MRRDEAAWGQLVLPVGWFEREGGEGGKAKGREEDRIGMPRGDGVTGAFTSRP